MQELNSKLTSWFEGGHIKEALIGDGKYFIPNSMYRNSHDLILVIDVLIEWSHKNSCMDSMGEKLHDAILELSKERQDVCADSILSYAIVARDSNKSLPCNLWDSYDELCRYVSKYGKENESLVAPSLLKEIEKKLTLVQKRNSAR